MLPFVIERLIISGLGKTDSVIEFSDGLTFVVGPSNTGKSHVMDGIDYLFGFSESATNPFRFEKDWGYDKFTLVVKTPHGRGRPGSCAGIGAVFFFAHSCTSFP